MFGRRETPRGHCFQRAIANQWDLSVLYFLLHQLNFVDVLTIQFERIFARGPKKECQDKDLFAIEIKLEGGVRKICEFPKSVIALAATRIQFEPGPKSPLPASSSPRTAAGDVSPETPLSTSQPGPHRRTSQGSMAASSPASSGKAASESSAPAPPHAPGPAVANGNGTPQKPSPGAGFDMPKPNLRGLNKPKCIQCGNVARSR